LFLYKLATDLGKSVEEILQLSRVEILGWIQYYEYLSKEQKKAQQKTRRR